MRDAVYPLSTLPPTLTSPLSPNRNRFKRIKFSLLNLNTPAHTHTLYSFIQNLSFETLRFYYCYGKYLLTEYFNTHKINSEIKINILSNFRFRYILIVGHKLFNIKDNKSPEQILYFSLVILAKLQ